MKFAHELRGMMGLISNLNGRFAPGDCGGSCRNKAMQMESRLTLLRYGVGCQ
jgi:hypothetical protein